VSNYNATIYIYNHNILYHRFVQTVNITVLSHKMSVKGFKLVIILLY